MARSRLIWGKYTPDSPPHLTDGLMEAEGVYAAAQGYMPIKAFDEIADALPGGFNGGAAFINSDGDPITLAGDDTDLYVKAGDTWTSIYGPATFGGRWQFTQFGNDVICTNGGTVVKADLAALTAGALGGSPPDAYLCCTARDQVILGRTDGNTAQLTWSAFNDATGWTAGTALSGYQVMLSGGKIMGITGGEYCLILQRYRIVRMSFTGDGTVAWQFDEISTNFGCRSEGSVVKAGPYTFYVSDRGFCMCDGASVRQIGAEVFDRTFLGQYDDAQLNACWSAADPARAIVVWAIGGKLWIYNWVLDRMTTANLGIAGVMGGFGEGVTLDDLDALYGDLDSVPYSLDVARFRGGAPQMVVIRASDGAFGLLTGSNVAARLTTPYLEPVEGRRTRFSRAHPLCDATSGITITVDAARTLGATPTVSTGSTMSSDGSIPVRAQGRYLKLTQDIAAGTDWTFTNGLMLTFAAGGER